MNTTIAECKLMVNELNKKLGRPLVMHRWDKEGNYLFQRGHLYIQRYDGWRLLAVTENGGETEITNRGLTAKELHLYLSGMLESLSMQQLAPAGVTPR